MDVVHCMVLDEVSLDAIVKFSDCRSNRFRVIRLAHFLLQENDNSNTYAFDHITPNNPRFGRKNILYTVGL